MVAFKYDGPQKNNDDVGATQSTIQAALWPSINATIGKSIYYTKEPIGHFRKGNAFIKIAERCKKKL